MARLVYPRGSVRSEYNWSQYDAGNPFHQDLVAAEDAAGMAMVPEDSEEAVRVPDRDGSVAYLAAAEDAAETFDWLTNHPTLASAQAMVSVVRQKSRG